MDDNKIDLGTVIPIVSAAIIFLGYSHLEIYYSMFGIDIYSYVDTGEILLSFYPAIKIFILSGFVMFILNRIISSNLRLKSFFKLEGLKFDGFRRANARFYRARKKATIIKVVSLYAFWVIFYLLSLVLGIAFVVFSFFFVYYMTRGDGVYEILERIREGDYVNLETLLALVYIIALVLIAMRWCINFLITIFYIKDSRYVNILVYCVVFIFVDLSYNALQHSKVLFHETPKNIYHFKSFVINATGDTSLIGQTNNYLFLYTSQKEDNVLGRRPKLREKAIVIKKDELESVESIYSSSFRF